MDTLSSTAWCATQTPQKSKISENVVRVSLRVLGIIYTEHVFALKKWEAGQWNEKKNPLVLKSWTSIELERCIFILEWKKHYF